MEEMQAISIDQVALIIGLVSLLKEWIPKLQGKITGAVAVAVSAIVYYGLPHLPPDFLNLIYTVGISLGLWSTGKNLAERIGSKSSSTPVDPPVQ